MIFTEAYHAFLIKAYKGKRPFCSETKEDLFFGLYYLEDLDDPGVTYYKLYLDSCGNIENGNPRKPLISYSVYKTLYQKGFEIDVRDTKMNNVKMNKDLCLKFNIPDRYSYKTFQTIDKIPEQEKQVNSVRKWCNEGFKESLLIGGKKGIGKTTLAVCSVMEFYKKNDVKTQPYFRETKLFDSSIIFIKESELFKLTKLPGAPTYSMLERLVNADFLCYDDMFTSDDKAYSRQILFDLIDQRVECKGKSTVITTHMPCDKVMRYYSDIYSRLSRGKIDYSNQAKDLRDKNGVHN